MCVCVHFCSSVLLSQMNKGLLDFVCFVGTLACASVFASVLSEAFVYLLVAFAREGKRRSAVA